MTNLQHLAIAITLQIVIGAATGNWWVGAALASGVFVGREHAQPKMWDFHSWFWNLLLPILAVVAIAGAMSMLGQ